MASVNKVIIVGNLGQDPEVKYMPNGDAVVNISVATTDKWKDKNTGEQKEVTEWHRINFFGKVAEVVGQYLRKGSAIYVEGSLRTRKWTDKEGIDRYTTEIKGDNMQMLGGREGGGRQQDDGHSQRQQAPQRQAPAQRQAPPQRQAQQRQAPTATDFDDDSDIPF